MRYRFFVFLDAVGIILAWSYRICRTRRHPAAIVRCTIAKRTPHLPILFGEHLSKKDSLQAVQGRKSEPYTAACVGRHEPRRRSSPVMAETGFVRIVQGLRRGYLFASALVMAIFLASSAAVVASPPILRAAASAASGGGSSSIEERRSPRHTMHVSAMSSCRRKRGCTNV